MRCSCGYESYQKKMKKDWNPVFSMDLAKRPFGGFHVKITRMKKAGTWSLQIILAMVFLSVGMAKISGVQSSIDMFREIGWGQWLRVFVGILEVSASVLLLFGPYATLGAGLLLISMAGAVMAHLWLIGGSIVPALVLGIVAGLVMFMRQRIRLDEEREALRESRTRKSA
jgi:putative oxidoreductase